MLIIIHWLKTDGWYRNDSYNILIDVKEHF